MSVIPTPWPARSGSLLLREASAADIEELLSFRNDPGVNRFMIRTSVEPDAFREEWLAVPTSETDFSCVAGLDGNLVAMGFLEIVDGMGQPGMPSRTEGLIGYVVNPPFAGRGVASELARGLVAAVRSSRASAGDSVLQRRQPRLSAGVGEGRHEARAAWGRGLLAR